MRVELIAIGSELLLGFTIDTNGAYLARELAGIGVDVARRAVVADDAESIAAAVGEALGRTGAAITTGGLGPTSDDMTKPAVAGLFGRAMELHPETLDAIERRFQQLGYPMPPSNRTQAMVPVGARILGNRHGTAPGIWLEDDAGRWVAMLPGVPRELRGMTGDVLIPLLRERLGSDPPVILSRTLRTTGIGESALAERLGKHAREVEGLAVASLPGWEGTDIRVTTPPMARADAEARLERAVVTLRSHAGMYAYGEGGDDLAAVVLALCRERGLHIATAESCTGGMLGARLTAIAGSSDVYLGGAVAYANAVKLTALGVRATDLEQHGAVSEVVAAQMAAGVMRRLNAEVGVGITGIAGPGGGTPDKPVGTVWIAVQVNRTARTLGRVLVGDRDEIRRRACQAALDMIRRTLTSSDARP